VHDWPVRDDRAARPDASRVVNAGRASGSVGLRNLNGEQPENQQGRSNVFHSKLLQFDNEYMRPFLNLE
jgi:hypothetical protein